MTTAILTIAAIWASLIVLFVWFVHRFEVHQHALAKAIEEAGQQAAQRDGSQIETFIHGERV